MNRVLGLLVAALLVTGCVAAQEQPAALAGADETPTPTATAAPTDTPTIAPTPAPTDTPTPEPTVTPEPTAQPTKAPPAKTPAPAQGEEPTPTVAPTPEPTARPIRTGNLGNWSGKGSAVITPSGPWTQAAGSWACGTPGPISIEPFAASPDGLPGGFDIPMTRPEQVRTGPVTITAGDSCSWRLALWK